MSTLQSMSAQLEPEVPLLPLDVERPAEPDEPVVSVDVDELEPEVPEPLDALAPTALALELDALDALELDALASAPEALEELELDALEPVVSPELVELEPLDACEVVVPVVARVFEPLPLAPVEPEVLLVFPPQPAAPDGIAPTAATRAATRRRMNPREVFAALVPRGCWNRRSSDPHSTGNRERHPRVRRGRLPSTTCA
jgi:hypothetical protein